MATMTAMVPPAPRDRIAAIAQENGWHRSISDTGNILVDEYTREARQIHICWSPVELAAFIEVGGEMCTHQAVHGASIDGEWFRDTEEALRSGISAALRS